ncbi:MAG: amidohydrolase [Candidatus Marinimicrobia bacterium]|jgi:predicted amidohydrolase YtcJ|nr:amidohydrolase [Candidatus Neomarinimicrobiota bacterium]MBT4359463.1 amidohydrolase [Candidatus Neomarinimicrobiota bacterium]MBT4715993.1 amidohydrolase [Candidatus Neomarinimicrobiota bacterium]MBT4948074.1 amidohydrolase [Candidatus Neomarinimicrobiota bacterium]MBT5270956.1 amidohydrolase [Candidatus Neomarinimicrobiota bacterium]
MNTLIAEKIYINGIILTQDDERSQVSQMATRGKTILAVGDDLSQYIDAATETIDLEGSVVVPGFIDAHVHFLWGGETLLAIPAHDACSKSEFIDIIRKFAEGRLAGSWLKGGGWNEHHFTDHSFPHKHWLDEAAPGHPMVLTRHDGHSGIASSAALAIADINAETPDPDGGVIDRDEHGEPTGILRDAAIGLVMKYMPEESESERMRNLETSQNYLLERGVTSVGDMIFDMNHFRFLQDMARQGKLKVRVTAYTPILRWAEMKTLLQEGIYEDEYFQYKGLKGFSDGSLGSHTALMLEPYEDSPDSAGIYDGDWKDINLIRESISEADKMGYQSVIHAIGDRAVREVLDVFEEVIQENGHRDRRFRIEHAQHIHPQDQTRFEPLDIIASVQPAHCVDDSLYADKLLGDRCEYAYPFRSLHQAGVRIAFGSDWPVSPADPVATIHGAIHRAGWHIKEAIGLNDSLAAHTRLAAYAGFREHDLGILQAGYLADFVVLDPDFQHLDAMDEIPAGLIQAVYMDGCKV